MHLKAQINHPLHLRELEHCMAALQVEEALPDLVVDLLRPIEPVRTPATQEMSKTYSWRRSAKDPASDWTRCAHSTYPLSTSRT